MSDDPSAGSRHGLSLHRLQHFDYASDYVAYFVTIRARAGTKPFTDPRLAQEVIDSLHWLRAHRGLRIYAYCLMPDHLHPLTQLPPRKSQDAGQRPSSRPASLADPAAALGTVIGSLKSFTTTRSWKLGCHGGLWQSRFYDHILRRSEDGHRVVTYILANPVRAGLVTEWKAYRFSGMPDPLEGVSDEIPPSIC